MSKIVIHRAHHERIINISDVQVFRASCKYVIVNIDGKEWFVKRPQRPTLKALHALSDGGHIYASSSALIAVSALVGRISDYEIAGHYGAVMRDGSIVKIARRESVAFNRVYRELVK